MDMNSGQIMVVCIVALVMAAKTIEAIAGSQNKKKYAKRNDVSNAKRDDILLKMNAQLDRITSRLAALETIVTDEDRELKREFKDLRSDVSAARKSVDAERN